MPLPVSFEGVGADEETFGFCTWDIGGVITFGGGNGGKWYIRPR